jgi:hypothetical protein
MLELSELRGGPLAQNAQHASSLHAGSSAVDLQCTFRVGGITVQIEGTHGCDVRLDTTVLPFRIDPCIPDIRIQVERVSRLLPSTTSPLFDSGSVWRLYQSDKHFQFDFISPAISNAPYKRLLVDRKFRRALLLLNAELFSEQSGTSPLEYPLDELLIMHRLTQERAIELHGVGIAGLGGTSNLFIGHSGAGKSTTARLWTSLHNVEILSDDRIIVREETRPANTAPGHATQIFMYGTPWHGEAHFALPQRAPLQRIFVLEHGVGNVITQLSPVQAVSEIFARSFVPFHRHEYLDHALTFLESLAASIPCYRYSFEPDQRAVETILQFHD